MDAIEQELIVHYVAHRLLWSCGHLRCVHNPPIKHPGLKMPAGSKRRLSSAISFIAPSLTVSNIAIPALRSSLASDTTRRWPPEARALASHLLPPWRIAAPLHFLRTPRTRTAARSSKRQA